MDVLSIASSEVEPLTHTLVKHGSSSVSFAVGETFSSNDDLKKKLAELRSRIQCNVHRETHELSKLQLEGAQTSRVQKKVSQREGEGDT